MLHAKFQSRSIFIDRYFQLSDSVTQLLIYSGTEWHTQDLELCTLPQASGTAKN